MAVVKARGVIYLAKKSAVRVPMAALGKAGFEPNDFVSMHATFTRPTDPVVCILDSDADTLETATRLMSHQAWQVQPFTCPDTLLDYARRHSPAAAVLDFGSAHRDRENLAGRLREISPRTAIIISLKVHSQRARGVLCGNELINLITKQCTARLLNESGMRPTAAASAMVSC